LWLALLLINTLKVVLPISKKVRDTFSEQSVSRSAQKKYHVPFLEKLCYLGSMKRENDKSAPREALANWYPGHMAKALRDIKKNLNFVDIVLEIRDARAPLVSANPALNEGLESKCRLILLNKANLSDPSMMKAWSKWFTDKEEAHLFINCFEKNSMNKVLSMAREIVEANRLKCNPDYVAKNEKLKIMIVGLPNTGKSTIINQLAGKSATKVADKPGQTKLQQWINIAKDIDLLDTPGVMPPKIAKVEHGLWLSAIHAIPDDIADEETTAIFVITHLCERKSQDFLKRYKLESFEQSPAEILLHIAKARGCLKQKGEADLERVYKLVLAEFRAGELGRTCFKLPPKS
jgi:ribosome biogenesis GTPase A